MEKKFRHLDEKKEQLRDSLGNAEAHSLSADARQRLTWLLFAVENGKSVEKTSMHFGISPTTFRRWLKRFDAENLSSLEEYSRRPHRVRQPDVEERVIALIENYRRAFPVMGPRTIKRKLEEEYDVSLSASTVWRVIDRGRLYFADTVSHRLRRAEKEQKQAGESDTPRCRKTGSSTPGMMAATFLLAVTAAFFSMTPSASAAGTSGSFRIDFDSLQTATRQGDGSSFTVIGGMTNIQKDGAGASFRIVPYGFLLPAAADSSSAVGDATTTSSGGGGSRGGSERMATIIREAHETLLQRIGRQDAEAEEERAHVIDSPVVRSYRERLLTTVDGRRVIYRDVPMDEWYMPSVAFVVSEGIARGYETTGGRLTGVFGVGNPVTKAEALKMTLIATGREAKGGGGTPLNRSAHGTWAEPYARMAEELGLSQYGKSVNVHEPQTRAGVIRTILEAVGLPLARKPAQFSDVPADHPDSSVIATAAFYDLISGFSDGTFRPQELMNRAAAAKVMTMVRNMLSP